MDDWSKSTDGLQAKIKQLNSIIEQQEKKLNALKGEQAEYSKAQEEAEKHAEDLKKQIVELTKQYDESVKATGENSEASKALKGNLDDLQKELNQTVKEQERNKKASENLNITILNQQASINKTKKELSNYENALNDVEKESVDTRTSLEKLEDTINDQEKEIKELKTAYMNACLEFGETSSEAQSLASKITSLNGDLDKNKETMNDLKGSANKLGGSLEETGKEAENSSDGYTVLKDVVADLASKVIQEAIQAFKDLATEGGKALDQLQASTGSSNKEMKEFKDVMDDLYKNNYGESWEDLAQKISLVKQQTSNMDLGSEEIKNMTKNLIILEDTFGMDFNETLRGVQGLMENMGVSADEAFNLIAKGAQNGLNKSDELGDNIAEYSQLWGQAGFSAEEMFTILQNGVDSGAYNLDKVNDLVKEIGISMVDGRFEDQMGNFSTKTQDLFKSWKNGKATQADVFKSIINDLSTAGNKQELLTVASDTWSALGEDNAMKVISSLNDVNDTYSNVEGTMKKVDDVKYDNLASQWTELGKTLEVNLIQPIVNTLEPILTDLLKFVINNMTVIAPIVAGVATAFGVLAGALAIQGIISGVQKAFALLSATMALNPYVLIASAIAGLVVAFIYLWNNVEGFRKFWIGVWDTIVGACKVAIDGIASFFSGAWDLITSVWSGLVDFFSTLLSGVMGVFSSIGSFFSDLFSSIVSTIEGIWNGLVAIFTNVYTSIVTIFSPAIKLFSSIFGTIFSNIKITFDNMVIIFQFVWSKIVKIFTPVIDYLTDVFESAYDGIQSVWNGVVGYFTKIWNGIVSVYNVVASWFTSAFNGAVKGIQGAWNGVVSFFSGVWNGIKSVFNTVSSWFGGAFQSAWGAVKSAFSGVGNFFSGIWNTIKSVFTNIGQKVGEAVGGAFKSAINAVLRTAENVLNSPINAINSLIGKINDVPGINLKRLNTFNLPRLAQGGLAKKNNPFLAMVGDNPTQDEIISPVNTIRKIVNEELQDVKKGLGVINGASNVNNVSNSKTVNNTFNQYITSPKTLSTLDIYRQSRNLLKGGVKS